MCFFTGLSTADVHEDVQCFLSEDIPQCEFEESVQRILIKLDSTATVVNAPPTTVNIPPAIVNVMPSLTLAPSTEMNTRDLISVILAVTALCSLGINLFFFYTQYKQREKDKNSERFNFWLKEFIFPSYIKPLLDNLSDLNKDYIAWVKTSSSNENTSAQVAFMDSWPGKKVELLQNLPNQFTLPYLDKMFHNLRERILRLDDYLLTEFMPKNMIFSLGNVEQSSDESPKECNLEAFSSLISYVYSQISSEQRPDA